MPAARFTASPTRISGIASKPNFIHCHEHLLTHHWSRQHQQLDGAERIRHRRRNLRQRPQHLALVFRHPERHPAERSWRQPRVAGVRQIPPHQAHVVPHDSCRREHLDSRRRKHHRHADFQHIDGWAAQRVCRRVSHRADRHRRKFPPRPHRLDEENASILPRTLRSRIPLRQHLPDDAGCGSRPADRRCYRGPHLRDQVGLGASFAGAV